MSKEIEQLNKEETELSSLVHDLESINRIYNETIQLEKEVQDEETKILKFTNDTRTIDEISQEYDKTQSQM